MSDPKNARIGGALLLVVLLLSAVMLTGCTDNSTPTHPAFTIVEFPITGDAFPMAITPGPDGNLWFTEKAGNRIGRITPQGTTVEFPLPTANRFPEGITAGPDGNLWFTELAGSIGRITPQGTITEFPLPVLNKLPAGITSGPDGNLWFTELA